MATSNADAVRRSRITTHDVVRVYVCDMQEKFAKAITGFDHVAHAQSVLIRGIAAMDDERTHAVYCTEQAPEKLGKTVQVIEDALKDTYGFTVAPKTRFSMIGADDVDKSSEHVHGARTHHIVTGIEAHVCVLQTVLDLLAVDGVVHVCVDAVSSIRPEDRAVALRRMESAGAYLTTTESVLFEMLGDANSKHFKAVSACVRAKRPETPPLPSI